MCSACLRSSFCSNHCVYTRGKTSLIHLRCCYKSDCVLQQSHWAGKGLDRGLCYVKVWKSCIYRVQHGSFVVRLFEEVITIKVHAVMVMVFALPPANIRRWITMLNKFCQFKGVIETHFWLHIRKKYAWWWQRCLRYILRSYRWVMRLQKCNSVNSNFLCRLIWKSVSSAIVTGKYR